MKFVYLFAGITLFGLGSVEAQTSVARLPYEQPLRNQPIVSREIQRLIADPIETRTAARQAGRYSGQWQSQAIVTPVQEKVSQPISEAPPVTAPVQDLTPDQFATPLENSIPLGNNHSSQTVKQFRDNLYTGFDLSTPWRNPYFPNSGYYNGSYDSSLAADYYRVEMSNWASENNWGEGAGPPQAPAMSLQYFYGGCDDWRCFCSGMKRMNYDCTCRGPAPCPGDCTGCRTSVLEQIKCRTCIGKCSCKKRHQAVHRGHCHRPDCSRCRPSQDGRHGISLSLIQ